VIEKFIKKDKWYSR